MLISKSKKDKRRFNLARLNKPCSCGSYDVVFIGIQEGLKNSLRLFNCLNCKTTITKKIYKKVEEKYARLTNKINSNNAINK